MGLWKGLGVWLVIFVVGAIVFAYSGVYDVSALPKDSAVTHWYLSTVRERSIEARADRIQVPSLDDAQMIHQGARGYASTCAGCHGAPGKDASKTARGMRPEPPQFHLASGEPDPRDLFWVAKHGIRMTGMPAWGPTHSDSELWDIVAFIRRLPKMSPEEYKKLTAGAKEMAENAGH